MLVIVTATLLNAVELALEPRPVGVPPLVNKDIIGLTPGSIPGAEEGIADGNGAEDVPVVGEDGPNTASVLVPSGVVIVVGITGFFLAGVTTPAGGKSSSDKPLPVVMVGCGTCEIETLVLVGEEELGAVEIGCKT